MNTYSQPTSEERQATAKRDGLLFPYCPHFGLLLRESSQKPGVEKPFTRFHLEHRDDNQNQKQ
jgi:hypothetical protein